METDGSRTFGSLLFVTALLVSAGCATWAGPFREFAIRPEGASRLPLGPDADDRTVIETVAGLIGKELGLPFPENLKVYVFVNEATLVDGLVKKGARVESAWERGRFSAAAASREGIFVRGDLAARMPLAFRAGMYAHELAHISQRKMAEGGQQVAAVWIREGHADWVRFQVLDRLGYRRYAQSRDEVQHTVLTAKTPVRFFPLLRELENGEAWTTATNRFGSAATYGQAFLAVDWLVERFGPAKLHEFFERFGTATHGYWSAVFPITYREFVDESRSRLERLQ